LRTLVRREMNDGVQSSAPSGVARTSRRGDVPRFEQIYAEHFAEVTRWVRALGGSRADVEDLAQEVFLVARRRLPEFDGGNLKGWLYRVTQLTVRAHRRRAWVRRALFGHESSDGETAFDFGHPALDPSQQLERQEAERRIAELLEGMSERRRAAFISFEIEGYTGEEIAKREGIPLSTVWTRLYYARKDFVRRLKAMKNR
jgi:RNA polymerase sigma-70 factor, ECF subfamily